MVNIPASAMLAEDGSEVDFDLEKLLRSEDGIRMLTEGVHESYARMPFGNPAYRALFGAIRAGQTPILFHCTAGKDRTGVAAALILKALGVSREDIVEDYLLTNACRTTGRDQFRGMLERAGLPAAQAQQVTEIATGVRRESIESALDAIEDKYPSFEEYLRAEFEIGAAELEDIRARYLV